MALEALAGSEFPVKKIPALAAAISASLILYRLNQRSQALQQAPTCHTIHEHLACRALALAQLTRAC